MACFRCNTTEDFIFSLKYRQRKVDVNTSKKLLVFITIQAIIYENFIFTQKYAFAERCCFLTFSFEGKLRKYDISVKHTKTNENVIFSALFTYFRKTKILFSCSVTLLCKTHFFMSLTKIELSSLSILTSNTLSCFVTEHFAS